MKSLALSLFFVLSFFSGLAAAATESYTSSHREASRLLAAIQPLYGNELSFSLVDNKIFIRGDADMAAEAISVLQEMDQPERYFRLRLSQGKPNPNSKTYSTSKSSINQNQSFALTDNKPLLISKRSESERLKAGGLLWYQTETVTDQAETIEIKARALTATQIELTYRVSSVNQSDKQLQASTVVVPLDEWYALSGEDNNANRWSTKKKGSNHLFIKLETY